MEAVKKRLDEDPESNPGSGDIIGGTVGAVQSLTESAHPTPKKAKRKKRRPIGFQLGSLGHLDRLE